MKLSHSWLCADCGCVNDNPHQCACGSQHGLLNLGSVLNREPGLCKCGHPHDNWPAEGGGMLCQMCWEAECSASWWRAVIAIDEALHSSEAQ